MIAIADNTELVKCSVRIVSSDECGTGDIEAGTLVVVVEGPSLDTTERQAEIVAKAAEEIEAELLKADMEEIDEQEPMDWPIFNRPRAGIGSREPPETKARSPPRA